MKKDFKNWHNKKSKIDEIEKRPFFHEREIWFCYLGANVGFEQNGRGEDFLRPVVIIKKFNNEICWAVPLTHTNKKKKFYFAFSFKPKEISVAVLSQLRLIDVRRMCYKIGEISEKDCCKLKEKLKELIP